MGALTVGRPVAEVANELRELLDIDAKKRLPPVAVWRKAIAASDLKPTTRHVLRTLSEWMGSDGGWCWPSVELQGWATGHGAGPVRRHLRIAEAAGWIETKRSSGRHRSRYRATVPKGFVPRQPTRPLQAGTSPPTRPQGATIPARSGRVNPPAPATRSSHEEVKGRSHPLLETAPKKRKSKSGEPRKATDEPELALRRMLARLFGEPETAAERAMHQRAAADLHVIGATPSDVVARFVAWTEAGWDHDPTPTALSRQWGTLAKHVPDGWREYPVTADLVAEDLLWEES